MTKITFDINPLNFTTSAFLIGIILLQELSNDEQESIGNWLQLVGLTMQTYASQYSTIHSNDNENNENEDNKELESLKKAVKRIEEELKKISKDN